MITLIFSIIFFISLAGLGFILYKKMPELNTLPQTKDNIIRDHHIVLNVENKIKETFLAFEKQIWLHKFLFWVKCMVSKTEHYIDNWLHKIRKNAQEKNKK